MAAPLQTFLFTYGPQMANKNIGLIVSSASSGISGVEADAKRLIPKGKFMAPSLWIRSSQTSNCHKMISEWLEEIDYNATTSISNTDDINADIEYIAGQIHVDDRFEHVSLFNINGNKILQTTDKKIDTSNIPSGVYVAKLSNGNNSTQHKLHIKN